MHFIIRTDGGARGNPGPAGFGVVIETPDGKIVEQHAEFIGHATNNQAEYRALVWGLRRCHHLKASRVDVLSDSELLVKQMQGEYRVKNPDLGQLYLMAKNLEVQIGRVSYKHVRRAQNEAADLLANKAMDEGMAKV